ncbi:MAG: hypothetical protein WCJ69_07845 [Betaproteobacteria bacterium]|jgi:hypothetical protein
MTALHRTPARAAAALASLLLLLGNAAFAREPFPMEVAWTDPRCDFIVTRNDAGHGVVMRLTPLSLVAGDVLVGSLDEVGYGRKIGKQGSDEAAMMQIRKYGIRRKVALDLVYEWSRYCNPPEE